jgi:hypothetical protein
MHVKTPTETLKIATEKRILNEFASKILNEERLDKAFESRKSSPLTPYSDMTFRCECDDEACDETILMSSEEYQQVHHKTRHFVVVRSHVRVDLEEVISTFNNYVLVGKFFPHPM